MARIPFALLQSNNAIKSLSAGGSKINGVTFSADDADVVGQILPCGVSEVVFELHLIRCSRSGQPRESRSQGGSIVPVYATECGILYNEGAIRVGGAG